MSLVLFVVNDLASAYTKGKFAQTASSRASRMLALAADDSKWIPVRRSSSDTPMRSFASNMLDTSSVPLRIALTSTSRSLDRLATSWSCFLRPAVLVRPSSVSQKHPKPRLLQRRQDGRWPEHFVFILWHWMQALLTGRDFLRALIAWTELASLLALSEAMRSRLPLEKGTPSANKSEESPRPGSLS
jgi:hypothetical protein